MAWGDVKEEAVGQGVEKGKSYSSKRKKRLMDLGADAVSPI